MRGEAVSISDDAVVIRKAYEGCEALTRDASKTFYFATLLMRERQRRSVWAIYGWCRTLDETVDAVEVAEAGSGVAEGKLRAIESQLRRMFSSSDASSSSSSSSSASLDAQLASSPETIALADTIRNTPGMSAEPFLDMIVGMRSDLSVEAPEEAPDAQPATRPSEAAASSPASRPYFRDWPELRRYCYNVAGTVGLMTLPVMGVAPGYEVADATPAGIDLGIALQLTNIIRDVGEDARRGRLYLPLDAVAAAGLTPEEVMDPTGVVVGDERYAALIEGEIRRAEEHFERARAGVPMLAPAARLPVLGKEGRRCRAPVHGPLPRASRRPFFLLSSHDVCRRRGARDRCERTD